MHLNNEYNSKPLQLSISAKYAKLLYSYVFSLPVKIDGCNLGTKSSFLNIFYLIINDKHITHVYSSFCTVYIYIILTAAFPIKQKWVL